MPRSIQEVVREFHTIENLPTLPVIALKVMEMIHQQKSMRVISETMAVDPPIVTKILKVANSAFYGIRQRVDTLRKALVVLGTNEIMNIVLGISFVNAFKQDSEDNFFDRNKFWEHSVVVGQIAKLLVKELNIKTQGEEYTAGLIHDIGKIILDQYFHEEFREIIQLVEKERIPNYIAEKSIINFTHMQFGGWLAEKWKLPENLLQCIKYHHAPELAESDKKLVAVVSLANHLADSLKISPTRSGLNQSNPREALQILKKYTVGFNLTKFRGGLGNELKQARVFLGAVMKTR